MFFSESISFVSSNVAVNSQQQHQCDTGYRQNQVYIRCNVCTFFCFPEPVLQILSVCLIIHHNSSFFAIASHRRNSFAIISSVGMISLLRRSIMISARQIFRRSADVCTCLNAIHARKTTPDIAATHKAVWPINQAPPF